MRTSSLLIVAAALMALLAVAVAQDKPLAVGSDPKLDEQVKQRGADAGQKAGAEAGAAAGAKAGRAAGAQAVGLEAFAASVSDADWLRLEKQNPGAAAFFKEFDENNDRKWSQAEWDKAIRNAQDRGLLPPGFDTVGEWHNLPKNEEGLLNLRDFLGFASKTKGVTPPAAAVSATANASTAAGATSGKAFAHCKEVFKNFDTNQDGGLDLGEFRRAVAGKTPDDEVPDAFNNLPHNGPSGTLSLPNWAPFCRSLTGLPLDENDKNSDPCNPNPCKLGNTVCVPDPKRCAQEPCPQFKCELRDPKAMDGKDVQSNNNYGKCIRVFHEFDVDKSRTLSFGEFVKGVSQAQKVGTVANTFSPARAWEHFERTPKGDVDVYQFVHFCIAVTEDSSDSGGSAKEECWDVFNNFDADQNQRLSEREFFKGMRRARRQGHIPPDLNIKRVWKALPKTDGDLEAGPFVDFCVAVSRGEDSRIAARDTMPPVLPEPKAPTPASGSSASDYGGSVSSYGGSVSSYQGGLPSTPSSNNVGSYKPRDDVFCATAFTKGDDDEDRKLSLDEFKRICDFVINVDACKKYSDIFEQFDDDKAGKLNELQFSKLCKTGGQKSLADYMGVNDDRVIRLQNGAIAGATAGAKAGAKAGRDAGRSAGAQAAQEVLDQNQKPAVFMELESAVRRSRRLVSLKSRSARSRNTPTSSAGLDELHLV